MSVTAWRIVRRERAAEAFSGEGARIFGGRWNSPGTSLVYTSDSLSLAALETLVHVNPRVPLDYVCFEVRFAKTAVEILEKLPADWTRQPAPPSTQLLGDRWAASGRTLALSVPSVLVPTQRNFLLNRLHPDFAALETSAARPFPFDPRLLKTL